MQVPNEIETNDILKFKPDRLGHCTCVHPSLQGSQQLFDTLLESKIPVGKRSLREIILLLKNILMNVNMYKHIYFFLLI